MASKLGDKSEPIREEDVQGLKYFNKLGPPLTTTAPQPIAWTTPSRRSRQTIPPRSSPLLNARAAPHAPPFNQRPHRRASSLTPLNPAEGGIATPATSRSAFFGSAGALGAASRKDFLKNLGGLLQ